MRLLAAEQMAHDSLIRMMVKYFERLGYTEIRAEIPGYSPPEEIYWTNRPGQRYRPDLTCRMNNATRTLIILEAETCNSLTGTHTTEQFRIFSAHARNNSGEFHVVVPRVCRYETGEECTRRFATSINVRIDRIWWPSA